MRRRALLPCVLVLVLATLAACSDDGSTVEAGEGPTTEPPAPAGLVLQIRTGGGFVPVDVAFATFPEFTLYGDGRVVVTGPTTLEYPGKALPNLLAGRVGQDQVRAAVDRALDAGAAEDLDLGQPPVADAPTTTVVVVDGGRTYRREAYALDFEEGPGLTAEQRDARRRLRRLAEAVTELGAGADQPYRPAVVSVLVRPYPDQDPAPPGPGEADWPLGDLAAGGTEQFGGRCLGFTGAEAERVLDAAGGARSNTRWRAGGQVWALAFRPELPGDPPCSA